MADVEIKDTPVKPEPITAVLTKEEMVAANFTPEEIAMYEKNNPVKKEDKEKEDAAAKQKADEEAAAAKAKAESENKPGADKPKPDEELTPEEEHEKVSKFNANEKALYFKQKKERQKRQEIQAERDLLKLKLDQMEKSIAELKAGKPNTDDTDIEDKEKVLTLGDLEKREAERERKRAEELKRQEEEQAIKNKALAKKYNSLTEIGRSKYDNFDEVVKLAREYVAEHYATSPKVRALYNAFVEVIESDGDSEESADIAYELGKLHPKFKESAKPDDKKAAEDKVKAEKILANQAKQKSSAAVGGAGNGSRIVSEDDLTPEDAARLKPDAWLKLKPATRERILKAAGK